MAVAKDITGQRFGRLVVLERAGTHHSGAALWLCACDCGRTSKTITKYLNKGTTKSCGCLKKDNPPPIKVTHGLARSPEYQAWGNMRSRCHTKSYRDWHNYGGRGIVVCERWNTFESFYADMGPRPGAKYSLDRIDNDGNYEPNNCRWATDSEQCNNRRGIRLIAALGRTQTIAQWSRETGLSEVVIAYRLKKGWGSDRALNTPAARRQKRIQNRERDGI